MELVADAFVVACCTIAGIAKTCYNQIAVVPSVVDAVPRNSEIVGTFGTFGNHFG